MHLPGFGDKGAEHLFIHLAMIERLKIGLRLVGAVGLALRCHLFMVGQPDHPAGDRCGSAKPVLLFNHPDRGPGFMRSKRRGQSRCTGADDQNIRFAIDYGLSPPIG